MVENYVTLLTNLFHTTQNIKLKHKTLKILKAA